MNLVRLIQQKPDERIIAVYRIYGLTKIGSIILFFILIILPFFLLTPLASRGLIGLIIFLLWLLGAGFYGARQLILWYFNVFVVTDRRAVDIDQRGFFDRLVSELSHQKIQDASYRIRGFFPTIFHYGTIKIEAAGGAARLELRGRKNPEKIVELLNELRGFGPIESGK